MGRDRTRVLVCAIAAIALILAGALGMDWYRMTLDHELAGVAKLAIDLRHLHACQAGTVCVSAPLTPLPGMFPTLAAVTMWSSIGVAALVALQGGARVLTGSASEALTKVGYMACLMAISIAVATGYIFGLDSEGPMVGAAAEAGAALHRTWAPATLIAGLLGGLAALYMAVAPESSDPAAEYKPVTLANARVMSDGRTRTPSMRIPFPESTGLVPLMPQDPASELPEVVGRARPITASPGRTGSGTGLHLVNERPTADLRRRRPESAADIALGTNPNRPARPTGSTRPPGLAPLHGPTVEPRERTVTGVGAPVRPSGTIPPMRTGPIAPVGEARTKTGPIPPVPDHLRNRLAYVALTAELTAGGIDARREDGSSRLVLWRDVVGVVARRLPDAYDGATFIDVVSTAGSTVRIVPWTRLTGEPVADGDDRPRGVVERVVERCAGARVDPATRQFLATGEAAQLPDLETLKAHDARLA